MTIQIAESDAQIAATYDVMAQLRQHLERDDYVRGMMHGEGFRVAALTDDGHVRARWRATGSCTCCTADACCTWTTW